FKRRSLYNTNIDLMICFVYFQTINNFIQLKPQPLQPSSIGNVLFIRIDKGSPIPVVLGFNHQITFNFAVDALAPKFLQHPCMIYPKISGFYTDDLAGLLDKMFT